MISPSAVPEIRTTPRSLKGLHLVWMIVPKLLLTEAFAQQHWEILDHSIVFQGSGFTGTLGGLKGSINFDPQHPSASSFIMTMDPATISTGSGRRDKRALSRPWLDTENYVRAGFIAEDVRPTATGYLVNGLLILRGISKRTELSFSFTDLGDEGFLKGSMVVNPKEHGIHGGLFSRMGREFDVSIRILMRKISNE